MILGIIYAIMCIFSWSLFVWDENIVAKICCGIAGLVFISLSFWYLLEEIM